MKATKLASIFAVTAVAAAVSTTTVAAEGVFSGSAGIEYITFEDDSTGASLSGTDEFEVEVNVDTGVVFAEIEVRTDNGNDEKTDIRMEKLYVKQGALSFGRFDGSVSTGAYMGIDEEFGGIDLQTGQGTEGDTDSTGIRYTVTPELTVAVEATEASGAEDSQIGFAASYVKDFGNFKAGVSFGSIDDATATNVGIQAALGSTTTLSMTYGVGEVGTDTTTDVNIFDVTLALNPTDDFYLGVNYVSDEENEKDGTYIIAEYSAGDLIYYVKNYAGDLSDGSLSGANAEQTKVGVKAEF